MRILPRLLAFLALLTASAGPAAARDWPGQELLTSLVTRFTGGTVNVEDVGGSFPNGPRIGLVELRDAKGVYARIENLALDWSAFALVRGTFHADKLTVGRIEVLRQPVASGSSKGGAAAALPVKVEIDALRVDRLELGAELAGAPAALALSGSAHLASLTSGTVDLSASRLDGAGTYAVNATLEQDRLAAKLGAEEPAHGLISTLAGLPDLGALSVHFDLDGPRSGAATHFALAAGALKAAGQGTINLTGKTLDLDLTASAPSMTPRPGTSWQSVALDAHVHGPFTRPDAAGRLRIEQLAAGGARLALLDANLAGNAGKLDLEARAEGVEVPGPKPAVLADTPLLLSAQMRLDQPDRPVTFALKHKLIFAEGSAQTAGDIAAHVALSLPDLAPLAEAAKQDLRGHARFVVDAAVKDGAQALTLDGRVGLTGGVAPAPALLGEDAHVVLAASRKDGAIQVSKLAVDGKDITLAASGSLIDERLAVDWKLALSRLQDLAPTVSGNLQAEGRAEGPLADLAVTAHATGEVAAQGIPRGPVTVDVALKGLPGTPFGHVTAEGELDRSRLKLVLDLARDAAGATRVQIANADWKSVHADGDLTLAAGATLPQGKVALRIGRLADLRPFVGQPLAGAVTATAEIGPERARLDAELRDLAFAGQTVARLTLAGSVADPLKAPVVDATLTASGLRSGAISGNAKVELHGPQDRLAIRLRSNLEGVGGGPAEVTAATIVDVPAKTLRLETVQASWKGQEARLLAPARIAFGQPMTIDHLRLALGRALLEVNGRVQPTLDLTASLRNVTPELAALMPSLQPQGTLQAEARLGGTLAAPTGTVRLTGAGLRLQGGPQQALPPAGLNAEIKLAGTTARVQARVTAGTLRLEVNGSTGLSATGPIDLRATGGLDLAMLNPILEAQGRRLHGRVTLDARATGAPAAPQLNGTVLLANGDVQDFAQGAHLSAIGARLVAAGDVLRIERFTARAGEGTISAAGTVGILAPGLPVDLHVTMNNARPLASDLISAVLDGNVALTGQVQGRLLTSGQIRILRADIQIPDSLPHSVAVLDVRVAGAPPPPPPAPGPDIALDLALSANRIFVRGHGLDAELGGALRVGGTAKKPQPTGAFTMRRGSFSLAGTTLNFTTGEITFTGGSNIGSGKIDPALHFVATSSSANVLATLTVGGYASDPKITLSSVPQLPQDEVLARLLFGQSVASLSPFQYAAIAQAVAQIAGVGGGGLDPLGKLRNVLGLDRLTVGTSARNPAVTPGTGGNNTNTSVEAGRYVAPGVYVGAKQGITGGGSQTQATVQIDITKHFKLETGVGSGLGANNVGVKYQFQY